MGCISSKVMSKSLCFKEELKQSMQRRSNSISSIQELIISGNKSDQLLNLVCSANDKLPTESLALETPESEPDTVFRALDLATTNRLMLHVDDVATRSPAIEASSLDEIKEDMGKKLTRSIHTVEEYDAILEKLWLSRSTDEASQKGRRSTEAIVMSGSSPTGLNAEKGEEAQEQNSSEKGFKRKAVAKGLESLSLPQTIEFQNVGSLKDWLQVCSPVTPKFGSYALPCSTTESNCSQSVAFNTDLVAAFEECMQQLQAEEEIVLKQIAEDESSKSHSSADLGP